MKNKERLLYQSNRAGYYLVLLFIVLNTVYSIFILNAMEADQSLGVFVMLTIFLLLLGFLTAVKVQVYSVSWSFCALVIGVFQWIRLFLTTNNLTGFLALFMNLILILSGTACVAGGIVSIYYTLLRKKQ